MAEQDISAQIKYVIADTVWHSICIYIHKGKHDNRINKGKNMTGSTILDIGIICMILLVVAETALIVHILT